MAKKLTPIPDHLIMSRIIYENCWWQSGNIDSEFGNLKRRLYFDLFFKLVEEVDIKRAVVLMGPRRVGKTVMMHHAIDALLQRNKIRENKICFINVENYLVNFVPTNI